jgi:hypothetical protein
MGIDDSHNRIENKKNPAAVKGRFVAITRLNVAMAQ